MYTQRVITHWKASCVSLPIRSSYLTSNNNMFVSDLIQFDVNAWFDKQRHTIHSNCGFCSPMIYTCTLNYQRKLPDFTGCVVIINTD